MSKEELVMTPFDHLYHFIKLKESNFMVLATRQMHQSQLGYTKFCTDSTYQQLCWFLFWNCSLIVSFVFERKWQEFCLSIKKSYADFWHAQFQGKWRHQSVSGRHKWKFPILILTNLNLYKITYPKNVQYPKEKNFKQVRQRLDFLNHTLTILMPRISLQMQKTHASNHW